MRVAFVTSGLEYLGIEGRSPYIKRGHEGLLMCEQKPLPRSRAGGSLFAGLLPPAARSACTGTHSAVPASDRP